MDNVSPPLKASRVVCSWQIFMPPFNHLIGKKTSVLLKKISIETEQLGWRLLDLTGDFNISGGNSYRKISWG